MGLDVYLYKYGSYEETKNKEDNFVIASDLIWAKVGKPYNELTEEERGAISKEINALAKHMGLDEYGQDIKNKIKVEKNSTKYPEHMFKIGYLRSSYNDGGINSVLNGITGRTLNDIFLGTSYCFKPDWIRALRVTREMINDFKAHIKNTGSVQAVVIDAASVIPKEEIITSKEKAIELYRREKLAHPTPTNFGSYSNINGHFYLDTPVKVRAMIPGKRNGFLGYNTPTIYVIMEAEMTWYLEALEIVAEMCTWVLKKKDRNKYYLHWSS